MEDNKRTIHKEDSVLGSKLSDMACIIENNGEKQHSNNSKHDTEYLLPDGNIKWNGHYMNDKSLKGSILEKKVACLDITQESCVEPYPNAILNMCSSLDGKNSVLPTEYHILQTSRQSNVQHLIIPSLQSPEVGNGVALLSVNRTVELIINYVLTYRVLEAFYHYLGKNAFDSGSLFCSLKATHLNGMFFGRKYLFSSESISQETEIPPLHIVKSCGGQMCRDYKYLSRMMSMDEGSNSCNSILTNKHDDVYDSGPNLFLLMFLRSLEILANLHKMSSQLQVLIEEGVRNNQTGMKTDKGNENSQTSYGLSCGTHEKRSLLLDTYSLTPSSGNISTCSVSTHSLNDKDSNCKFILSSSSSSSSSLLSSSSSVQSSTDNKVVALFGTETLSIAGASACHTHGVKNKMQSEETNAINKGSSSTNYSFQYKADPETALLLKKGSQHGTDKPFAAFINIRNNSESVSPAVSDTVSGQSTNDIQSLKIPAVRFDFSKGSQILFNTANTHLKVDGNSVPLLRDVPFLFGATTYNSTNKSDCISATITSCRESTCGALSSSHIDKSLQAHTQVSDVAGDDGLVKGMVLSNNQPFQTRPPILFSTVGERTVSNINLLNSVTTNQSSVENVVQPVISPAHTDGESVFGVWCKTANMCNNTARTMTTSASLSLTNPVITSSNSTTSTVTGASSVFGKMVTDSSSNITSSVMLRTGESVSNSNKAALFVKLNNSEGCLPDAASTIPFNVPQSSLSGPAVSSNTTDPGRIFDVPSTFGGTHRLNKSISTNFLSGTTDTITTSLQFTFSSPATTLNSAICASSGNVRIFTGPKSPKLFNDATKIITISPKPVLRPPILVLDTMTNNISKRSADGFSIFENSHTATKTPSLTSGVMGAVNNNQNPLLQPLNATNSSVPLSETSKSSNFGMTCNMNQMNNSLSGAKRISTMEPPSSFTSTVWTNSVPPKTTTASSVCEGRNCTRGIASRSSPILQPAKFVLHDSNSNVTHSTTWASSHFGETVTASSISTCGTASFTIGVSGTSSGFNTRNTTSCFLRAAHKIASRRRKYGVKLDDGGCVLHTHDLKPPVNDSTSNKENRFVFGSSSISQKSSPFRSIVDCDISVNNGVIRTTTVRFQNITCMPEYNMISQEELRHNWLLKETSGVNGIYFNKEGIKFKCSKDVQTDTIQLANIELSKIWSILECPVCLEVALPPIYQCDKGHHACNNCWKKLKSCPLCKSYRSMMSRNFVAEAIAEVVVLPCRFHIEGCSETVLLIDKPQHEAVCFHRTHQCPVQGCKESYSYHNMTCHLSEKHGYTVKVKTQAVTEWKKFSEVITMFSLTPLVHAYNILGWGLFFLCHNSLRSTAALWMQMIPTTQDQASFKYQVEVMDHLGCRGVSYTGAVANMDKTVDEILQKDEFLTVPNNILKSLKQHHNLKITIRIWP